MLAVELGDVGAQTPHLPHEQVRTVGRVVLETSNLLVDFSMRGGPDQDGQIIDEGVSTVFYTGDLLTYAYPLKDLDHRLDLVYSAPGTRVYR